ncbi:MAG: orotate phosphoribosyltransferase, partial [Nocardioidaceae bacterium]
VLAGPGTHPFQDSDERRDEVARDIVAASHLRGRFVLSSGQASDFYFDKYLFSTKPTVLRRLASLMAARIPPHVDRVAGAELGAVPIAAALSLETGLPFVVVRKNPKPHGTRTTVEGELHQAERVLLVEDVVTTGAQALRAAGTLADLGADVVRVLAVVDREQGGGKTVAAAGLSFDALFRLSELPIPAHPFDSTRLEHVDDNSSRT